MAKDDLFYSEELDAWLIQIDDEITEDGMIKSVVIYPGNGKPTKEKIDELLDFIMEDDEYVDYYKEIITILNEEG
jgi:hypothetical protein